MWKISIHKSSHTHVVFAIYKLQIQSGRLIVPISIIYVKHNYVITNITADLNKYNNALLKDMLLQ